MKLAFDVEMTVLGDLDLVRELPYRPAAVILPHSEAGQMAASDHALNRIPTFFLA